MYSCSQARNMNTSFQKTSASDEWYTPKELIDALGEFDLDPCAALHPLFPTAHIMFNKNDDGLSRDWGGMRVFCNPPYSPALLRGFCNKMVQNNNGILLVFARMGNDVIQNIIIPNADAVLFLRKRIRFLMPDGKRRYNAGADSALFAFGQQNVEALEKSGLEGFLICKNGPWKNIKEK